MSLPKISIVTPSYNQGRFLEWTLRSVILQRYPGLEYIVMDGGSTDGSVEILESYDDHLAQWVSEPDGGQASAIARGLSEASGEIMAFLNSDDMLAPDALHFVADFFNRNPNIDALYSHRCAVNDENIVIYYWILPRHSDYLMSRWDLIPQETCFWRRHLWERAGNIDPEFEFALDYDLFIRFMRAGKMTRINRFLGAYREHESSKTARHLDSLGLEEIQRVWSRYKLRSRSFHTYVYPLLKKWVEVASSRHVCRGRRLPGALAATGWHYDELWGRQLTGNGIPPHR